MVRLPIFNFVWTGNGENIVYKSEGTIGLNLSMEITVGLREIKGYEGKPVALKR